MVRRLKIALCEKSEEVPQGDYIFERKVDGIRAVAVDGRLYNRDGDETGRDITDKFPEIEVPENFALDGEIVNDKGVGSLTGRVNCDDDFRIEMKSKTSPAVYKVFDLIMVGSTDYRKEPLMKRKAELSRVLENSETRNVELVKYSLHGEKMWKKVMENGWEGLVAKKLHSSYPKSRSKDWLKVKNFDTEVFDVVDYGYTEDGGFVIFVDLGGGETQKIVVNERKEQEKIKNSDLDLNGLKAEVRFLERTEDSGRLRHISYEGIVDGES